MLQCIRVNNRLAKLLVIPILITFVISVAATFYMGKKAPTPSPSYSEPPPATGMDKNITSTSNSADTVIAQPTPTPTPTPTQPPFNQQNEYKEVTASIFWIGEKSDESNNHIPNDKSAWDSNWQQNYGGVDDPDDRCGFLPCEFTPKENPFYFALPYNDLDKSGNRKSSAAKIPWFEEYQDQKSVLKNRWVEIVREGQTCYAQWQDVGPLETDDFDYVFGSKPPKNQFGVKAGIDLSPAIRDCLGMNGNDRVFWKFVNEDEVPPGPWKQIVTNSPVRW